MVRKVILCCKRHGTTPILSRHGTYFIAMRDDTSFIAARHVATKMNGIREMAVMD